MIIKYFSVKCLVVNCFFANFAATTKALEW